jgi:methylthioribose-1-phosphate isomerase
MVLICRGGTKSVKGKGDIVKTLEFRDGALCLLDQTKLPVETMPVVCRDERQVAEAIVQMKVRGAPAIGLAAAYGVVLAARSLALSHIAGEDLITRLEEAMEHLRRTRPTAVNLSWALARMHEIILANADAGPPALADRLLAEANRMLHEDEEANRSMGGLGAELVPDRANVLTHCNAGALATGAYGTALGVIRAAHEQGKRIHVWVDETRPLLQGARLTAWELKVAGVPCTLITDSMAGYVMSQGRVDAVIVGADRIAANGDGANKIGTYGLAILARAHNIPFYFVAPTSTIDLATPSGARIPIEERNPAEVTTCGGAHVAPEGIAVANPAFDITPARLVTAIVTEQGVVRPPFQEHLARVVARAAQRAESSRAGT